MDTGYLKILNTENQKKDAVKSPNLKVHSYLGYQSSRDKIKTLFSPDSHSTLKKQNPGPVLFFHFLPYFPFIFYSFFPNFLRPF